jgi:MOSC domain-containing protein YiiM
MTGHVKAVCIGAEKGAVKVAVPHAKLCRASGLEGDAHAGTGHRQVSLLADESIARIRAVLPDLADGAFAENIVTAGFALAATRIGDRIRLGPALLEVTQIGKECHNDCAIRRATGDCIMPREGVFCRVLEGGVVAPGDPVELAPSRD